MAADPKNRKFTFKPRCRFLGRHGLGSRLEQLGHQAISPLALALEISPMGCRPCFELPNFFLQCLDLCRQYGDVASLVGTWWPRIMPYLS
ncbi:MAG: hypothetical protein WBX35_10620, partial [Pseudolabrys sp.]